MVWNSLLIDITVHSRVYTIKRAVLFTHLSFDRRDLYAKHLLGFRRLRVRRLKVLRHFCFDSNIAAFELSQFHFTKLVIHKLSKCTYTIVFHSFRNTTAPSTNVQNIMFRLCISFKYFLTRSMRPSSIGFLHCRSSKTFAGMFFAVRN